MYYSITCIIQMSKRKAENIKCNKSISVVEK